MSEPIMRVLPNVAPEPCGESGCRRAQASWHVLYRYSEHAWRPAGVYRCDEHRWVVA